MPAFGRVPSPDDPRDAAFPMSLRLQTAPDLPRTRMWRAGKVDLDQGSLGACVGFSGANWLQNTPIRTPVSNADGIELYGACKQIDGLPPGVEGTYVRCLFKVLQGRGQVGRYLWARNSNELVLWVSHVGPVIVGTLWYEGMSDLSGGGSTASLTGSIQGGHAYMIRGYDKANDRYRCVNSWGSSWGSSGEFWISRQNMDSLLFISGGEAVGLEQV